jgi:hypothetical protein
MADGGFASSYLPALSRLMGEVEQPTQTQSMMSPQFGGSPEQLMGILQHPQTQQLLQQLGIHFDPNSIKQSPFLPQHFMQQHPHMGGALSNMMSNAAATREAPLVSGAGSGISRAMQGMMGGPELQRQYQVKQMLAPMQAMGSMIPGQEFQRKQQLLQLLTKMEEDRQRLGESEEFRRQQADLAKKQQQDQHLQATRPYADAAGRTWTYQEPTQQQAPHPEAGPWGGSMGLGPIMAPGAPAQPGGFQPSQQQPTAEQIQAYIEATHPERGATADEKQAEIDAGLPGAKSGYYKDRGEAAKTAAGRAGGRYAQDRDDKFSAQYNNAEKHAQDQITRVQQMVAGGGLTKEVGDQQIKSWQSWLATQKANIDQARGKPGDSGQPQAPAGPQGQVVPPQVAPGASPGAAQAGGPGANKNQNVATPPNPQAVW